MTDLEKIKRAIEKVGSAYACDGNHDSDLIAGAFSKLLDAIEYEEQFAEADKYNEERQDH